MEIEQVPNDRIVNIRFQTTRKSYRLIVALTGRHANLVVVNEQGIILHSLHPTLAKVGQLYCPPKPPPHETKPSRREKRERDVSNHVPLEETDASKPFPCSRALEEQYNRRETDQVTAQIQLAQTGTLRKDIKKLQRKILAYKKDLQAAAQYKEYHRYGELLKHHLGHIRKGQTAITLVDYFDETLPELTLPLDPSKDPRENMESYFRKHRKYAGAERELSPRLEKLQEELIQAHNRLTALETGIPQLKDFAAMPTKFQPPSPARHTAPSSQPASYRRFLSVDGLTILVGRNARENDQLTFREAQSHDLWFHARDTPGSHVLLKVEKGTQPPHESIRDAATLALLYSDRKKSGKGEVMYTQKKHVKKAKGQKPGAVLVSQEKAIWAELDPERLSRLKISTIRG